MTAVNIDYPPLVETGVQQTGIISRLRDIWKYRELLGNLARKELRVKYKDSVLGFLWSLLNPLLYLAIYSIVFGVFLGSSIQLFGIFLLCGLLPFNLFSMGLTAATTSITGNGPLVQKVWFPREILPIAAIGANLITFFLQLTIIVVGLAVFRISPDWAMLWTLIPALIITLMLATGLGLILSAINVYFRDVQHFLELGLLTLFWFTPIVYSYEKLTNGLSDASLPERLGMLNPMVPIVTVFQRVLYNPSNFDTARNPGLEEGHSDTFDVISRSTQWHMSNLLMSFITASILLIIGFKVFSKLEANLGEEI